MNSDPPLGHVSSAQRHQHGHADPRMEWAVLEMTRRFREPLPLQDLAAAVGLSPHHFHRLFLAAHGETPMAYLRRIRLSHADHLLAALPDASLVAVAIESGFSSPACFSRAYRQAYGQSPGQVRASLQRSALAPSASAAPRPRLCHIPTRRLRVMRQTLDDEAISRVLAAMAEQQPGLMPPVLGIFVDAPFHVPAAQCRYFMAWERDFAGEEGRDVLTLPGGYYARLEFTGPTEALGRAIFAFHDQVLLPSAYALASTLFFERLHPQQDRAQGYAHCKRELFLKVRRKGELVI